MWACEVGYCINMYDMCHYIHFCVFNFLHTLAFVSTSDIDKYICGLFLESVLIFFIKAHFFSCCNVLLFQNLNFEDNY